MDYPHPNIQLDTNQQIDLSNAYGVGLGAWDSLAIRYGYGEFANEDEGLAKTLSDMLTNGLVFISDEDARAAGVASAEGHLWDNGTDPVTRFLELGQIRQIGINGMSTAALRQGQPTSWLEQRLVPVYLLQRFQLEAVVKLIGGQRYQYRVVGDGLPNTQWVKGATQQRALDTVLDSLDASRLALPGTLLDLLDPPTYGYPRDREAFTHGTGATFDPLAPARALSQWTAQHLFHPLRMNRLAIQNLNQADLPSLTAVLSQTMDKWINPSASSDHLAAIQREVAWVTLTQLLRVYPDPSLNHDTRAQIAQALGQLQQRLETLRSARPRRRI